MDALHEQIQNLEVKNRRLLSENRDLRDLCCFLDDERIKGRKLAKEWQKFGRYSTSILKSQVNT